MTTTLVVPEESAKSAAAAAQREPSTLQRHWKTLLTCLALAIVCGVATSYNTFGNPIRFKDEGVYLAQAWAIPNLHTLANYTYWYDHPPLGWVQMSLWATVTDGWDRWHDNTTMAGREFMVVVRVVTSLLIFALGRRLGMRRSWAAVGVLIFIFSPLAMYYGRLTLLDNVAMPWIMASLFFAWSPRRAWSASIACALCFGVAVMTKETLLMLVPAIVLALWSNYRHASNRHFVWVSFGLVLSMSAALYPLYAIIKSELVPGVGHVSLVGALQWQLSSRKGSGSVFDANSDARNLLNSWLALDPWLPACGLVASLFLLGDKRFRPIALALAIELAMLLRKGYLPSMYVVSVLPFMALSVAAASDKLWPSLVDRTGPFAKRVVSRHRGTQSTVYREVVAVVSALMVMAFWFTATTKASTKWVNTLAYQWTVDADAPERQVVSWLKDHVPHGSVVVAEGEMWLDLHNAGFSGPGNVWVYKVDSDPAVTKQLGSWRAINYLALSHVTLISESKSTMPMVFEAVDHATRVAAFGQGNDAVEIMKVSN